ncbi:hypothetical protein DDZ18_06335 [Marinicauda salina]|uniref:YhdP central domain-containing protein n=1 Tax=Marinicauda salina TaxID=2135793 RepID=A0A2U2BTH6_9PROT|nr:AsmA-like C-terminal region-containing protein [Marinicauda salina]PWE17302.1 hypothetical protein DDZ18_06335 [Marinicauda salina]
MRRAARLSLLYVLEALAALLALVIFTAGAALWRLAEGPVDAEIVRPAMTDALLEAFEGDAAAISALTVSYDPAQAAIVLAARDVSIAAAGGEVVARADRLEAALALDRLIIGRAAPVRLEAEGGAFALVRRADGTIAAGLGRPERFLSPAAPSEGGGLRTLLGGLADAEGEGMLSRLREIDFRGTDIRIRDEVSDLSLFFDDARAQADLSDARVQVDISGALVTSAGRAPVAFGVETDRALETFFLDLRVRDLAPAAAAPRRGPMAWLSGVEAPVDIEAVIDATQADGLRSAFADLNVGEGVIRAAGEVHAIESGGADIVFDIARGEIEVSELVVRSDLLQLDASGRLFALSDFQGALPGEARYEIAADAGVLDLGGVFPEPIAWDRVAASGSLRPFDVRMGFETLEAEVPGAVGRFEGAVSLEVIDGNLLPNVRLEGPIDGDIGKADVLRFWPVDFALGARDWLSQSILGGRLSRARMDMDISAAALADRFIEDEALSLSFHFADADVRYVSTMTPLRGLTGQAELRGNSLSLTGTGASIGEIEVERIFVEIPRLNPKGATARFGGTARSAAEPVIRLLDQEPLGFASDYGIDPAQFDGVGTIDFEIRRPMRRFVPVEEIGFDVSAEFGDVTGPAGLPGARFTDGDVRLEADPSGVTANAEATLAGSRADIVWTEAFGGEPDAPSTAIEIATTMDGRSLDELGLPLRRFLDGSVGLEAVARGRGFEFETLEVSLDLADAAVALPADLWSKPAGAPGAAAFRAVFAESGALQLDGIRAEAEGAALQASVGLAPDGRLLDASAERVFLEDVMELSAAADRPEGPDGPLRVRVTGAYLNARDIFDRVLRASGFAAEEADDEEDGVFIFEGAVEQVAVRDSRFQDVDLFLRSGPDGLERFALAARSGAGPVEVAFGPAGDGTGERTLTASTADAGGLLAAFTGYDNARGGALVLSGRAPPLGQSGGLAGDIQVDDFTLERLPLLARVLAAGSLEGLAGLLSGEGIVFETLEAGFVWNDGVLELESARTAGPSLGVTYSGVVDFQQERLALDGTLLPSYGVNSALGGIPVLGELLTSRRGEGVFGVTFSVSGPFEETRVVANPLSALAPGVFRRIFEGTSAERELEALEAQRRAAEEAAEDAEESADPSGEDPSPSPDSDPGSEG